MYDRLTKKQRFIDQMLVGDIEGREFDDPLSEEQASLSEMMAAFSGNPLVSATDSESLEARSVFANPCHRLPRPTPAFTPTCGHSTTVGHKGNRIGSGAPLRRKV
jgi:hypothetical protein